MILCCVPILKMLFTWFFQAIQNHSLSLLPALRSLCVFLNLLKMGQTQPLFTRTTCQDSSSTQFTAFTDVP